MLIYCQTVIGLSQPFSTVISGSVLKIFIRHPPKIWRPPFSVSQSSYFWSSLCVLYIEVLSFVIELKLDSCCKNYKEDMQKVLVVLGPLFNINTGKNNKFPVLGNVTETCRVGHNFLWILWLYRKLSLILHIS